MDLQNINAYLQFTNEIVPFYHNDPMSNSFAAEHHSEKNDSTKIVCRFNHDTIIVFHLPQKDDDKLMVKINYCNSCISFEVDDFINFLTEDNKIAQSWIDKLDLQIIKNIRILQKIKIRQQLIQFQKKRGDK